MAVSFIMPIYSATGMNSRLFLVYLKNIEYNQCVAILRCIWVKAGCGMRQKLARCQPSPLMMRSLSALPLPTPPPEEEGTNEPLRECFIYELAGLPALWFGEPGQVRKEAAIAKYCKCRG